MTRAREGDCAGGKGTTPLSSAAVLLNGTFCYGKPPAVLFAFVFPGPLFDCISASASLCPVCVRRGSASDKAFLSLYAFSRLVCDQLRWWVCCGILSFFFSQRSQCVLSHVEDGILLRVCDFRKCAAAWPYRRKRKSFQASQRKRNTLGSCERNMTSCRFYCSKT